MQLDFTRFLFDNNLIIYIFFRLTKCVAVTCILLLKTRYILLLIVLSKIYAIWHFDILALGHHGSLITIEYCLSHCYVGFCCYPFVIKCGNVNYGKIRDFIHFKSYTWLTKVLQKVIMYFFFSFLPIFIPFKWGELAFNRIVGYLGFT